MLKKLLWAFLIGSILVTIVMVFNRQEAVKQVEVDYKECKVIGKYIGGGHLYDMDKTIYVCDSEFVLIK